MLTNEDYRRFGNAFYDEIIDFIRDNVEPEDLYTTDQLCEWAKGDHATLEDMASLAELEKWALDNGFVKETEEAA